MGNVGKGAACATNLVGHYWSLSLEEQFYFLYPFLFLVVNRKVLVATLCIAIIAQFFWLRPTFTLACYFRTDALFWGVLIGLFSSTNAYAWTVSRLSRYRHLLLTTMLIFIVLLPMITSWVGGDILGNGAKSYATGLVALVCAYIVLVASYDFACLDKAGVLHRTMLYLGSRSYSLYVTHYILFTTIGYFGARLFAGTGPSAEMSALLFTSLTLLSLVSTFVASELSYRYVEARYRPKGRQFAKRILKVRELTSRPSAG